MRCWSWEQYYLHISEFPFYFHLVLLLHGIQIKISADKRSIIKSIIVFVFTTSCYQYF